MTNAGEFAKGGGGAMYLRTWNLLKPLLNLTIQRHYITHLKVQRNENRISDSLKIMSFVALLYICSYW